MAVMIYMFQPKLYFIKFWTHESVRVWICIKWTYASHVLIPLWLDNSNPDGQKCQKSKSVEVSRNFRLTYRTTLNLHKWQQLWNTKVLEWHVLLVFGLLQNANKPAVLAWVKRNAVKIDEFAPESGKAGRVRQVSDEVGENVNDSSSESGSGRDQSSSGSVSEDEDARERNSGQAGSGGSDLDEAMVETAQSTDFR